MDKFADLLCKEPYFVQVPKIIGGLSVYKYEFESKQLNTLMWDLRITISNVETKRSVTNSARLLLNSRTEGVILATHLNGKPLIFPIATPVIFKRNLYQMQDNYNNIRSIFTMNRFEESFGWFATLACTHIVVRINDREMIMEARGWGGVTLNKAEPSYLHEKAQDPIELQPTPEPTVT